MIVVFYMWCPNKTILKVNQRAYSGFYSCERCTVKGESIDGRLVMATVDCQQRTDEAIQHCEYHLMHQLKRSILPNYGVLCISQFVLDYMHLVCLGVTRWILTFIKEGPRLCKLSQQQLALLSSNLAGLKGKIPSDFARQPRSLDELKRWKATEFHQFLLYTGPAFMKDILSQKSFEHFLALSKSIRIMIAYSQNEELLDYSKELLLWFVKNAGHFYGSIFKVYNVHNLIHLHDDIIHHKVLTFWHVSICFWKLHACLKKPQTKIERTHCWHC